MNRSSVIPTYMPANRYYTNQRSVDLKSTCKGCKAVVNGKCQHKEQTQRACNTRK